MKKYRYSKWMVCSKNFVPLILMVGLFGYGIYGYLIDEHNELYKLLILVMPFLILSSVIGLQFPSSITVTKEGILFEGFGRQHKYDWSEVKNEMKIKKYDFAGQIYIRIGNPRIFGGRYWISYKMDGYSELLSELINRGARVL